MKPLAHTTGAGSVAVGVPIGGFSVAVLSESTFWIVGSSGAGAGMIGVTRTGVEIDTPDGRRNMGRTGGGFTGAGCWGGGGGEAG